MSLPEGKYENFRQKQFTLVQEVLQSPKYSTMMCERLSPFLISKTRNNSPLKSRHYTLSCHRTFYTYLVQLMLISSPFFVRATKLKNTLIIALFCLRHYMFTLTHQWQALNALREKYVINMYHTNN